MKGRVGCQMGYREMLVSLTPAPPLHSEDEGSRRLSDGLPGDAGVSDPYPAPPTVKMKGRVGCQMGYREMLVSLTPPRPSHSEDEGSRRLSDGLPGDAGVSDPAPPLPQ